MAMFSDIKLTWTGVEYKIPANKVMMALAVVEEIVTLQELASAVAKQRMPIAKLTMAFGALLRFAGADVKDEDIYSSMFAGTEEAARTATAISALLHMMVPKNTAALPKAGGSSGNVRPTAASSKKRTKQPSV